MEPRTPTSSAGEDETSTRSAVGGSAPRSAAGGSAPRDASAVDIEHVVYSTWPVHKSGYPSEGPLSFKQLTADAYDMGCKLSLRSHGGTRRTYRPNVLTVKGPTCWEVYKLCLVVAKQLNLDLSRVPPLQIPTDTRLPTRYRQ